MGHGGAPGMATARIVIIPCSRSGPSNWVVTRAHNYFGAFIAAVIGGLADDGTAPVLGCQIKNWEKVKVWLQAKYR